jgi:hypothetical protein
MLTNVDAECVRLGLEREHRMTTGEQQDLLPTGLTDARELAERPRGLDGGPPHDTGHPLLQAARRRVLSQTVETRARS